MQATTSQLRQMLTTAPKEALAKTITPHYGGERFYCLACQESRWDEMRHERREPNRRLGRPLAESWITASIAGPRAWFPNPSRWRCGHCRAWGTRSDLERHIVADDELTRRFFIVLEGLTHAA